MLGELVPVLLLPAAALALAMRSPGRVSEGRAPLGPELARWLTQLGLLLVASWLALSVGPSLTQGSDLGGFALTLVMLPLTLVVAYSLLPANYSPAAPKPVRPPKAKARSTKKVAATSAPAAMREAATPQAPTPQAPTPQAPVASEPSGPRTIASPQIDGQPATQTQALERFVSKLGQRPALVFSPRVPADANEALHRIAAHLGARRYICATPSDAAADSATVNAARVAAGPSVAHASELALDLAGGAVDSILLIDDVVALSPIALQGLQRVESTVFCAEIENEVSAACDVRIPSPAAGDGRAKLLTQLAELLNAPEAPQHLPVDELFSPGRGRTLVGIMVPPPSAPGTSSPPPPSSAPGLTVPPISTNIAGSPLRSPTMPPLSSPLPPPSSDRPGTMTLLGIPLPPNNSSSATKPAPGSAPADSSAAPTASPPPQAEAAKPTESKPGESSSDTADKPDA